ncbi:MULTISPECIES: hypothetical protein [unclassified Streptomyces]|uniref:hypothetical protein n=1 Tax=unclassified Streptomyces TaxID=2593676 RepID=UPI002E2C98AF|nr:hypothetical protein [Streptomyces sp. NBC_00223]
MTSSHRLPGAATVPFITLRENEHDVSDRSLALRPFRNGLGLCYADEHDDDRDPSGILHARVTQTRNPTNWPTGKPRWKQVHPTRQRECATHMLCHVCKEQPSRNEMGILFIDVLGPKARPEAARLEGMRTFQPPVCLPHAKTAIDLCPHLQRNTFVAMRVATPRLTGMLGTPYTITGLTITPAHTPTGTAMKQAIIPFNHPQRHYFLGAQYAIELNQVTVIDLEDELAKATARGRVTIT